MSKNDPDKLMLRADKLTKLSLTRWSADWRAATLLYEQAAVGFRIAKDNVKLKLALEKASKGQEMLSAPWDAAKHMESAGAVSKELGSWNEVADFYRRASELYNECGRPQPAADALAKGARAIEDASPDEAIRMYTDACAILEEDHKEHMAFDLYRAATSVYLKLQRYTDAATFLLRWGLSADQCKAINSQCNAYLSAIVVYLYAHDVKQAEKCYNDCSQIEVFLNSDQSRCASKLLSAYAEGDIEEIKRVAQSSTISNLDHMFSLLYGWTSAPFATVKDCLLLLSDIRISFRILLYKIIRLARKLPTGDVSALQNDVSAEEPLDENDLT